MLRCPTCDGATALRATNAAFPFCSPRCKAIDLGKWLNEEYRVPVVDSDEEEAPLAPNTQSLGGEQE
jgi:endogenous inhibitor of DNA gyrase (YacG/DUF329 family)